MRSGERAPALSSLVGKTGIFLLMLSVIALFGALSLAFIATPFRNGEPFSVPDVFYFNTLYVVAGSVLLHQAWVRRRQRDPRPLLRWALILGVIFLIGQAAGWTDMLATGIAFEGQNPKSSYLYLLSGVHAVHLIGGLAFLGVVYARYQRHAGRYFELAVYFWHFLGILWIYLLAVMLMAAQDAPPQLLP